MVPLRCDFSFAMRASRFLKKLLTEALLRSGIEISKARSS